MLGTGWRFVVASLVLAPPIASGQPLAISHDFLDCWPSEHYPLLRGQVSPPDETRTTRIYFRAVEHPDFYYVDAELQSDGRFEAVLPAAAAETERVVYYIEALSLAFESARTREEMPPVAKTEECRRRDPLLALFPGDVPKIVVGAVRAGAPLLPPGFQAAGLATTSGGAGLATAAVVAAAAGGAAAGGVVLATGSGAASSSVTTSVVTVPPSTSVPTGTTTMPGTSSSPSTTTTSTGTGTTSSTATSTTTTTGPASTTTTSSSTTTSEPPSADLSVRIDAPSSVALGNLLRYRVLVQNHGPSPASGVHLSISLPLSVTVQSSTPGCSGLGSVECDLGSLPAGGSTTVEVTVLVLQLGNITATASVTANQPDPVAGNNSSSVTTNVTVLSKETPGASVAVVTQLRIPRSGGGERGQVVVDSTRAVIESGGPAELRTGSQTGDHTVEAVLLEASGKSGTWRFELRAPAEVDLSGITIDAGEVAALEPWAVTFTVRGQPGERLRFRFRSSR